MEKKKIDLAAVLSGEYRETIEIIDGLSIKLRPMTFKERQIVSDLENEKFGEKKVSVVDRSTFVGKHMASYCIETLTTKTSAVAIEGPEKALEWLDSLPSSVAEIVIGTVTQFVGFYVSQVEGAWKSDPFGIRGSRHKQLSQQEE